MQRACSEQAPAVARSCTPTFRLLSNSRPHLLLPCFVAMPLLPSAACFLRCKPPCHLHPSLPPFQPTPTHSCPYKLQPLPPPSIFNFDSCPSLETSLSSMSLQGPLCMSLQGAYAAAEFSAPRVFGPSAALLAPCFVVRGAATTCEADRSSKGAAGRSMRRGREGRPLGGCVGGKLLCVWALQLMNGRDCPKAVAGCQVDAHPQPLRRAGCCPACRAAEVDRRGGAAGASPATSCARAPALLGALPAPSAAPPPPVPSPAEHPALARAERRRLLSPAGRTL